LEILFLATFLFAQRKTGAIDDICAGQPRQMHLGVRYTF
jgi:hypothetical protein